MARLHDANARNVARRAGERQPLRTLYMPSVNAYQRFERTLVGLDKDVSVRGRHDQSGFQERRDT